MVPRSLPVSAADFGDAVWCAADLAGPGGATVATGHALLDAQLPGGGWPVGAISEILQVQGGENDWRLVLPALARLKHRVSGPVVLVGAPHVPFGPGLASQGLDARGLLWLNTAASAARLWSAEQALRCAAVAAVLAWLPQVRAEQLRRLQTAAQAHGKLLFVMRPAQARAESSPAVLRLLVSNPSLAQEAVGGAASTDALLVQILKRRGPPFDQLLALAARPARLAALLAVHRGQANAGQSLAGAQPQPERPSWPRSGDALDRTAATA